MSLLAEQSACLDIASGGERGKGGGRAFCKVFKYAEENTRGLKEGGGRNGGGV